MKILASATSLSNEDLLARLTVLAAGERHASVELVAHLAALEARPGLYLGLGFGSLFSYCTAVLRLSEDAACTRIAVAGACRRFPVILDLLASGATNLTNIRRLAGKLTPENHEAVLARAVNRSREDVERLLRELDPLPDLRSSVRKAAAPRSAAAPPAARPGAQPSMDFTAPGSGDRSPVPPPPRPVVRPSAPERYHVKFTIGEATRAKLRRVQALLRREVLDGDPGVLFDRGLDAILEKAEAMKRGARSSPKPPLPIRPGTDDTVPRRTRYISKPVRRVVSARDGDRCAYVSPDGRRCTETAFLEFHHVRPYAYDGPPTVENISLRCRAHNQYEADQVFGPHGASKVRETRSPHGSEGTDMPAAPHGWRRAKPAGRRRSGRASTSSDRLWT